MTKFSNSAAVNAPTFYVASETGRTSGAHPNLANLPKERLDMASRKATMDAALARKSKELGSAVALPGDYVYWNKLAKIVGWRLLGYSNMSTGSFVTRYDEVLQLSSSQRDDILSAIEKG